MNAVAVTCADAQTDYPDTPSLDKDQIAKILVTSDQDALLLKGSFKKMFIRRARHAQVTGKHEIMSKLSQEANGVAIDILIDQKPHAATGARLMSSAATRSMAY